MSFRSKLQSKLSSSIALVLFSIAGASASLTVTTLNQQGTLPFTPTWVLPTNSLIAGLAPSSSGGDFSLDESGRNVNSLTSGDSLTISQLSGNNTSTNYITCGNGYDAGSNIVYTLPSSANGYDLTNLTVYGGWKDNGRDQQAYTVYYSTVANPASFILLTSINFNPSVPANTASATEVAITDPAADVIVSNVAAVKFDFTTPSSENGYCGYAAITLHGSPSSPPSGPPIANAPQISPAMPVKARPPVPW